MDSKLVSMLLTVASNAGYHFCQKEIDAQVPPFLSLAVSYAVGLMLTLMLMFLIPGLSGSEGWRGVVRVGWASYLLGFALVGLELGFLLAYRAGWKISNAAIISNVAVTLLLIPVGVVLYRDEIGPTKVGGIVLALLGLWLIGKK